MLVRFAIIVFISAACATAAVRKSDTAEGYYNEGMENFKKELWIESTVAFNTLKQKFPYSKYASLAELRIADLKFANDRFTESIEAYRLFVQYHPNHEEVGYAIYKEALAHYKETPDDFFFMPPAHEKDQVEVERAARGFKEYLERWPDGEYKADAYKKMVECNTKLAQHDLYVARFYAAKNKNRGAAARYETARGFVKDTKLEPEVLLELGETYVKLGEKDKSRAVLGQLIEKHPTTGEAQSAKKVLAGLK